jgi:hypothetical protein
MSEQKQFVPPKFEYPNRMTARNEITGAAIQSKGTNQDKYAAGWDLIFGKNKDKQKEVGV